MASKTVDVKGSADTFDDAVKQIKEHMKEHRAETYTVNIEYSIKIKRRFLAMLGGNVIYSLQWHLKFHE